MTEDSGETEGMEEPAATERGGGTEHSGRLLSPLWK